MAFTQRDDESFKQANTRRDMAKYREYLFAQVRELLTGYGKLDYIFFDFSYTDRHPEIWGGKGRNEWGSEELLTMAPRPPARYRGQRPPRPPW